MTEERIIEEMARLDGKHTFGRFDLDFTCMRYDEDEEVWMVRIKEGCGMMHIPPYLTSHDAVQLVVDGLDDDELQKLESKLWHMNDGRILKATPAQKCEAILKTKGVWE